MVLINGDSLDELKKIEDNKVNLVITSPPYNMNLRIRDGKYCSRQIVKEMTTKYINYDDNLSMEDYFNFNRRIIEECLRISSLTFYNVQFLTGNKRALFKIIGYFNEYLKEIIIWDKINAEPAIGIGIMNSRFEVLLVFDNKNSISRKFDPSFFERGTLENLWQIKRGKKINKDHGAVFPEELVLKIIENFSKEGETILDPFMGSGTTGVVCYKNKRNFIGIEIDKDYFNFSKNRIESLGSKIQN